MTALIRARISFIGQRAVIEACELGWYAMQYSAYVYTDWASGMRWGQIAWEA